MEKYPEKILSEFSPLDLMAKIKIEFSDEYNRLPSDFEIQSFISKTKAELIESIKRLSPDERIFLFENLIKRYQIEYSGIRKYFIEQITPNNLFSIFPDFKEKKSFELSPEEIAFLEKKYSLYPFFQRVLNEMQIFIDRLENNLPHQQIETKIKQETIEMKPVLKPEAVQIVFDILKNFFSPEQQIELKQILKNGNIASTKMLFKDKGNRLTDTFKKLIEHDFITGCQKQDLINWIISNFTFTQQNKAKAFIYYTVEKTISRNDNPCKSPLIEIKNGQIQKVEQPRTKKYRND